MNCSMTKTVTYDINCEVMTCGKCHHRDQAPNSACEHCYMFDCDLYPAPNRGHDGNDGNEDLANGTWYRCKQCIANFKETKDA